MAVTKRVHYSKSASSLTILAGALASANFGTASETCAQNAPHEHQLRMQYSFYKDWQGDDEDRMIVRAPQILYTGPVAQNTGIEIGLVYDAVSGASPLNHDTLSGASGVGIKDDRRAGDIKVTHYFEGFSVGVGGSYSKEDDYKSAGAAVDTLIWNEDKSTVYSLGISGHTDEIGSTNNPELDESSDNQGYLIGITQIIDKYSLAQFNMTYSSTDGYQSDPYKLGDNRPMSRDEWAFLARYAREIQSLNAAFHADYRFFYDSWGIDSHLLEVKLYQPVTDSLTIRPLFRYYTQDKADFYSTTFPPPFDSATEEFYSTDQRISGFGAVGAGLGLIYDWDETLSTDLSFEYEYQSGALKLFSPGSPGLKDFNSLAVTFGISKKF